MMKSKVLGVIERLAWALAGAGIVLIIKQDGWQMWLKEVLSAVCAILVYVFSLFVHLLQEDKKESYSSIKSARKDTTPQPMSMDGARIVRNKEEKEANELPSSSKRRIQSIVLINEEGTALTQWSMTGKASLVIGKGTEKEPVDIDLCDSAFAQMISKQHAVLNYTEDGWYLDDIDSKNGTRVKKLNRNSILDLNLVGTVEVGVGDIIYIANTMLQLR